MSFVSKLNRWKIWIKRRGAVYGNPDDIKTYQDWLNSGYWSNIKHRFYKKRKKICNNCGSKKMINLHHKDYGSMFYGNLERLIPLCYRCHQKAHFYQNGKRKKIPSTYTGRRTPWRESESMRKYLKENPQGVFTRR